jgi:uncharacterized protein (DUF488 family)
MLSEQHRHIFTVGHSDNPIEWFIDMLRTHYVTALADVRSSPFSRFNPQFNRASLAHSLASAGIRYEFLGEELGARSSDPACFENGRVSYARLAATPLFRSGLDRLREMAATQRVAIMCAEREPLDCHRTILITRELERAGEKVSHILADGTLEGNLRTMGRLIDKLKLPRDDLFGDPAELIDAAYDAQAAKVAYAPKTQPASGGKRSRS